MNTEITQAEQAVEKMQMGIMDLRNKTEVVISDLKFPNKGLYAKADEYYNEIHSAWSKGEQQRLEFTKPLNAVLKKINEVFKSKLDPLEMLKRRLKGRMDAYATDELIWRRKEEQRIQDEKRKAEELARAKAEKQIKKGNLQGAAETIEKAMSITAKEIIGATDKGQSTVRTSWKATIVDFNLFLKGIIDGSIPPNLVEVNMVELNKLGQSSAGKIKFPGVAFEERASVGARI